MTQMVSSKPLFHTQEHLLARHRWGLKWKDIDDDVSKCQIEFGVVLQEGLSPDNKISTLSLVPATIQQYPSPFPHPVALYLGSATVLQPSAQYVVSFVTSCKRKNN